MNSAKSGSQGTDAGEGPESCCKQRDGWSLPRRCMRTVVVLEMGRKRAEDVTGPRQKPSARSIEEEFVHTDGRNSDCDCEAGN